MLCVEIHKIIQSYIIEDDSLDARICLFPISNEAVGIASVVRLAVMESIILMSLILSASLALRCIATDFYFDFCNFKLPTQMGL